MVHSKLRQAVAMTVAALALLGLAAPAAQARKPVVQPPEAPPAEMILLPIKPIAEVPLMPCICLPPIDGVE